MQGFLMLWLTFILVIGCAVGVIAGLTLLSFYSVIMSGVALVIILSGLLTIIASLN